MPDTSTNSHGVTKDDAHIDEILEEEVAAPKDGELEKIKKQLTEQEEIARRAQSDYLRTKMEFDAYVKRTDDAKAGLELDGLMKALEKVLPFVNHLKVTLDNVPEDLDGHARAQGVQLLYTKMIADIALLGVSPIEVILGTDPDYTMHIPIGMEETENEKMKNKVIKEVEGGFVYEKGDTKRVVIPAKVMVGS